MQVDDRIGVITPEAVEFTFDLSGLASRVFALIVDIIIQIVAVFLVVIILGMFSITFEFGGGFNVGMILLLVSIFLFEWGYFIFFELIWNGRSPGKKLMGCRVIRDGGLPVNFTASFIRNLIRPVDYFLSALMIGFFIVFASPTYKRLGDMAAGTLVVVERRMTLVELMTDRRVAAFRPSHPPLGLFSKAEVSKLTPTQLNTIRRFLDRRYNLTKDKRAKLGASLYVKIAAIVPAVEGHGINTEQVLEELVIAAGSEEITSGQDI